jgi:hypothetical protein
VVLKGKTVKVSKHRIKARNSRIVGFKQLNEGFDSSFFFFNLLYKNSIPIAKLRSIATHKHKLEYYCIGRVAGST